MNENIPDTSYKEVRVGISIFIVNDKNQILLGKRIGKHGEENTDVLVGIWNLESP